MHKNNKFMTTYLAIVPIMLLMTACGKNATDYSFKCDSQFIRLKDKDGKAIKIRYLLVKTSNK